MAEGGSSWEVLDAGAKRGVSHGYPEVLAVVQGSLSLSGSLTPPGLCPSFWVSVSPTLCVSEILNFSVPYCLPLFDSLSPSPCFSVPLLGSLSLCLWVSFSLHPATCLQALHWLDSERRVLTPWATATSQLLLGYTEGEEPWPVAPRLCAVAPCGLPSLQPTYLDPGPAGISPAAALPTALSHHCPSPRPRCR